MNNESSESQDDTQTEKVKVAYKPTEYADATWEIVGEPPKSDQFQPMELERVDGGSKQKINPIFADYNEEEVIEGDKRWHLPKGLMHKVKKAEEEEKKDTSIRISEEDLETIRQERFEKGQAEGQSKAAEKYKQDLQAMEEKLSQTILDMDTQLKEQVTAIEKEAIQLALAISKKIVTFAVEICPEYIEGIVESAISKAGAANISKVRVSPEDMEFIEIVGLNRRLIESETKFEFEGDSTIKNGCIVETSAGEIDFQLDEAWERIKDNILKVIR